MLSLRELSSDWFCPEVVEYHSLWRKTLMSRECLRKRISVFLFFFFLSTKTKQPFFHPLSSAFPSLLRFLLSFLRALPRAVRAVVSFCRTLFPKSLFFREIRMGGQKGCQRQNILLKSGLEWEGSQPCGNMSKYKT